MLQAEDKRQEATAELAARERELAKAQKKAEGLKRHEGNGKPEQSAAEVAEREQEVASARRKVESLHSDEPEGRLMLTVGCILAAIAGIGLITATMLALTVDTQHVTTAGVVAAISAGGMLAVLWVGFVANWYRKHTAPVQDETRPASNGSRSQSKSAASKR